MPRIRSGSNDPAEEVTPLNITLNSVVCEAFYNSFQSPAPTSLQWYNDEGNSLMLTFETSNLATNIKNLTSPFRLVNANNKALYYECCTLIGQIKNKCTKAYLSNSLQINCNI